MVALKIIGKILRYFFLIAGTLYLLISPITSSIINCINGNSCIGILEDTGGLLFNSQQNIKEFVIRIIDLAPQNPQVYDKVVIDVLKANIWINLGIFFMILLSLFMLYSFLIGKGDSLPKKISMILISILLALATAGILTIVYNLIIPPHNFVNPYDGIIYLIKNIEVLFTTGSTLDISSISNLTLS